MKGKSKSFLPAWLPAAIIVLFSLEYSSFAQNVPSRKYDWKSVQIVGGGFVDGIVFHPKEKGLVYCRTDMGGAYRRNAETLRWEPLLDWVSANDVNLMGIESIALDPSDPDKLYIACGTYSAAWAPDGAILRSNDRGKAFKRTNVPFKMGGNEDGRGNGERMAVDPNNNKVLYLGTRHDGLWISTDQAVSWSRIDNFPDITENPPPGMRDADSIIRWRRTHQGCGINVVLFNPGTRTRGKGNSEIYVAVSLMGRENLFFSSDEGKSWNPVPGQPVRYRPTHAVISPEGIIYLSYGDTPGPSNMTNGAVWKYNTVSREWTDITPDRPDPGTRAFGYAAVAVDLQNPQTIITSTYHRYGIGNGEDIFRSLDAGKSWKPVFGNSFSKDSSLAPYTAKTGIHWLFDLEIDPFNPDHAMFTTGYGGHETFNLTALDKRKPTNWTIMSTGIEETVALELLSPSKGAQLVSAIGDYGGFVHFDLDKPAPEGSCENPRFGNTSSVSSAEANPDIIVRTGRAVNEYRGKNIAFSTNGGKSWQPAESLPDAGCSLGHIAVSADGLTWIWTPDPVRVVQGSGRTVQGMPVYFTRDRGAHWEICSGIAKNTAVIADKINSLSFYAMNLFEGKLFISKDGGAHFTEHTLNLPGGIPQKKGNRGDARGGQDRIYAAPGKEGDLWIAAFDGLYHSTDTGNTFNRQENVMEIYGFGFGKGALTSKHAALYLAGIVNGVNGVFRSDDNGSSWLRINDDQNQWGKILHISGDPKRYGRVYIGTHGRGILYGDPL